MSKSKRNITYDIDGNALQQCSKCKVIKSLSEFTNHTRMMYGKSSVCKVCHALEAKDVRIKHRTLHGYTIKSNAVIPFDLNGILSLKCGTCKQIQSTDRFIKQSNGNNFLASKCKSCLKLYQRESHWKRKLGIDYRKIYDELFDKQNGCCAICNRHSDDLKNILYLDHCHQTNKVRGLLCESCNFAIGSLKDSIEIMQNAIKYIIINQERDKQ